MDLKRVQEIIDKAIEESGKTREEIAEEIRADLEDYRRNRREDITLPVRDGVVILDRNNPIHREWMDEEDE